jgi:fibronectin-binding autotransporter adhesin
MKNKLLKKVLKSTAAKLIAAFLMLSSGQSNAATSTNTNTALPWNTSSSGWTGVTGDAWDSTNGRTNTAVFTNALGSITVTNSGIWFNGITYSPAAASSFTILGGTLNLSGSTPTINVSTTGSAATISAIIQGTAGLVKSGNGTLVLSGANTYTGTTTISAGRVNVTGTGTLGSSSSVTLADVAGATLDFTGASGSKNIGLLSGGGTNGGNVVLGTGRYYIGSASNSTYGGIISGSGQLQQTGAGTTTLSGNNIYTGYTIIGNNGALSINSIANVGGGASSLGAPTTAGNGKIFLGQTTTSGSLIYTGTGHSTDRQVDLAGTTGGATLNASGSGALVFISAFVSTGNGNKTLTLTGTNTADNRIGGAIVNSSSGATSLTKSGTGKWVLSGANTYTGVTTVSAGTLLVNTGASITASASQLNGGTLDVRGTIGSVTQSGGTLLVSGTAGATVINSGTSTVNAGGTIGSTTINGSLLSVNGNAGNVLVNSGGTLGGSGSVQGLTLNGGIVAPGNSPGLLTAYELNGSNGTFQFQLGAPTTRGSTYDAINVTTLLTLGASTAFTFETLNSHTYTIGDVYDLFDFASIDVSAFDNAVLLAALPDLDTANSNLRWDVNSFNADGIVNVIPEPSTLSLMLSGFTGLIALRMMRKNG